MHCIDVLACGVNGAEGGTASLYTRGTSTPAAYYLTAEADGSSSTDEIQLDSYGAAVVYVNEYVDVIVKSSGGAVVREFTAMSGAADVEVRNAAFTGTNYTTAASAAGNPVALDSVLSRWRDSAGSAALDWNVVLGGSNTTLQAALGPVTEILFNVKDSAYGATGDGTTNDATAINAAIAAAAAVGGIVYFPPGTYRITSALTPSSCSLVGAGAEASSIAIDSASANAITWSTSSTYRVHLHGLRVGSEQTNTGRLLSVLAAGNLHISDCYLDGANSGTILWDGAASGDKYVTVTSCIFMPGANQDCIEWATATGRLDVASCRFVAPASHSPSDAMVYGSHTHMRGCEFDLTNATSGTIECVESDSTQLEMSVIGCKFLSSGGATVTAFVLGTFVGSGNSSFFVEDSNIMPSSQDSNFTAYSYHPAVANGYGHVVFGSKRARSIALTGDASGVSLAAYIEQYGMIYYNKSGTTDVTFVLDGDTPRGDVVFIEIRAGAGTVSNVVTAGTGVSGISTGGGTLSNASSNLYTLVSFGSSGLNCMAEALDV